MLTTLLRDPVMTGSGLARYGRRNPSAGTFRRLFVLRHYALTINLYRFKTTTLESAADGWIMF